MKIYNPSKISNESKTFKLFKEVLKEICSNSTSHAIPNIARTENSLVRVLWVILLLGGTGAGIYYFYSSLYTYFQYNVTVSTQNVLESSSTFPAVTICNLNSFDTSISGSYDLLNKTISTFNISYTDMKESYISTFNKLNKLLKSNAMSDLKSNSSTTFKDYGFKLESMLISCYFDGTKCTVSDFTYYYTYEYGNCYIFNLYINSSTSLKTISGSGPSNGLNMEIFVGYPGEADKLLSITRGLYVAVHNNSQYPNTYYEGLKIPVGYQSDIGVTRTFYNKASWPYSDCREDVSTILSGDSQYYQKTLSITSYSRKLCYQVCLQYKLIVAKCNCADPSMPIVDNSQTICHMTNDLGCAEGVRTNYSNLDSQCSSECPLECDRVVYTTNLRMANYPTDFYYENIKDQKNLKNQFTSLNKNISKDDFKQSVLFVKVFYDDLYYTYIEEDAQNTPESTLGVIGGQLGLFLGVSFLSFFEIFEFLIEFVSKYRKQNQAVSNMNSNFPLTA